MSPASDGGEQANSGNIRPSRRLTVEAMMNLWPHLGRPGSGRSPERSGERSARAGLVTLSAQHTARRRAPQTPAGRAGLRCRGVVRYVVAALV